MGILIECTECGSDKVYYHALINVNDDTDTLVDDAQEWCANCQTNQPMENNDG